MKENRAVVLGGFAAPGTLPCWIIRVRSKHDRVWLIRVECDEDNYRYRISEIDAAADDAVPWEHWLGRSTGKRPLIDGDEPMLGAYERMKATAKARRTQCQQAPRDPRNG